jgi:L,D-peptidoglycan transpeptidase YkuD (ErfK/YbiS/YcfS/YnhG family)
LIEIERKTAAGKHNQGRRDHMQAIVTANGSFTCAGTIYRAALGRGGVRPDKQEGDGATPIGALPLRSVLYRPDRVGRPASAVATAALTPTDGWCDDPGAAAYNRPIQVPAAVSAEALWRDDAIYDIIGILGWNDDPIVPGRGSAIFLHLARPGYTPTDGCIALSLPDLQQVLALGLTEIIVRA